MPEVDDYIAGKEPSDILKKRRVVIFSGIRASTGNPFFTTNAAAALRAAEHKLCAT